MSLFAINSGIGKNYHEREIVPKVLDVNFLPGIEEQPSIYFDDNVCIVSSSRLTSDHMLISDSHVVAMEGYILGLPSLRSILDAYLKSGDSMYANLNGNFNLIIYDINSHVTKIANCRNSVYNLYYKNINDVTIISSNVRSIVRCLPKPAEIDLVSVYKLFSFQYVFGDGTLIKGIKRVKPASILSIEAGKKINIETYWKPEYKGFFTEDLESITNKFNDLLVQGTQERFDQLKDIKIFLSGGLDSRLIAGAAEIAGISTETVTYGFHNSNDVVYGRRCSDQLGYKNHLYLTKPGSSTKYSEILSLVTWLAAANTGIKSMTSTKYHEFLIDVGVQNYSHGSTIGLLSSKIMHPYMFYPGSEMAKIQKTLQRIGSGNRHVLKSIIRDGMLEIEEDAVKNEFISSFENVSGRCFADKFLCWYFLNREPRTTFESNQINGYYFNSVHFFLDSRLLDFYFRVPLRYRHEALWQKLACITINDKIKDIPYHLTGQPISANLIVNFWNRLNTKIRRNTKYGYQTKHKDAKRDTLSDAGLMEYLLDEINSASFLAGILDREKTNNVVKDHFTGQKDATKLMLILASVSKFYELFIKEKCEEFPTDARAVLGNIPYPKLGVG